MRVLSSETLLLSQESVDKMESFSVIKYQFFAFNIFGMLPDRDSSRFYKFWALIVFAVGGIGLVLCQSVSVLYIQSTDDLVKELLLLVTTATAAMKIALFHLRRSHLMQILKILQDADDKVKNQVDNHTMQRVFKNSRRITAIYTIFYLGSLLSLFLEIPFLDKHVRTWKSTALVPNDIAQNSFVYYGILILEIIGNSLNCIICLAIDSCGLVLINLLCGHIEVLALQLKKLGTKQTKFNSYQQFLSNRLQLKKCIDHYDLLVK